MEKSCFLCRRAFQEDNKFNVDTIVMEETLLSIKEFMLRYIFDSENVILCGSEYICLSCLNLLKQLEESVVKCKDIQQMILNTFINDKTHKEEENNCDLNVISNQINTLELELPPEINVNQNQQCIINEIPTSTSENLVKQQINAKNKRYNFICEYCDKSFTQKIGLQRHLPLHTGVPKYTCNICDKNFIHHSSFNFHKQAHIAKPQFKCGQCAKALISKSSLKRHMKTHTKERKFACAKCSRRFAERHNLIKHMQVHIKNISTS